MESEKPWMQPGVVTACVLALAAGWVFYAQSIVPLKQRETAARRQVGALKKQIAEARREASLSRTQAAESSSEDGQLNAQHSEFPAGPALVWLPERMQQHFGQCGFAGVVTRLNTVREEKDLPGYERSYWRVSIPIPVTGSDTTRLLRAVADLDAQNTMVRVMDFAIGPDPQNPVRKMAAMNVSALLPK